MFMGFIDAGKREGDTGCSPLHLVTSYFKKRIFFAFSSLEPSFPQGGFFAPPMLSY
jgi:hypothetical protein